MDQIDSAHSTKKHALIATVAIMGSRVFGLVREQVFAIFFGASFALDAYITAFRIPNLLRDLFAEGALSQSFVTVFSQKSAHGDDKQAYTLANQVSTFIIFFIGSLVVLGIIFSPTLVHLIANGFEGEKFELTVSLNRIMFPFILFVAMASILMGMLNAKNRYFLPQSASTFFNITSVLSGVLFAYLMAPEFVTNLFHVTQERILSSEESKIQMAQAITGMAFGTVLGGLVQWLVQLPSLIKLGYHPRLNFAFNNPDFIRIIKLTLPAIIGGAAVQINVMINTFFASYLETGSISYLNYAFRFMQFPLGLFGVAIASASAPALAKMLARNDTNAFKDTMSSSLEMSLFFCLPSMLGLFMLAEPIIALIYQHGRFSVHDMQQTALALRAFSVGILGYSLIKIYLPAYLAHHDSRTPMFISMASILFNTALNYYFMVVLHYQHWGLALSTSFVALFNLFLLGYFFRKRKQQGIWNPSMIQAILRICCATLMMGLVVWLVQHSINTFFIGMGLGAKTLRVLFPMMFAIPTYLGLGMILKIKDAEFLLGKILRKRR